MEVRTRADKSKCVFARLRRHVVRKIQWRCGYSLKSYLIFAQTAGAPPNLLSFLEENLSRAQLTQFGTFRILETSGLARWIHRCRLDIGAHEARQTPTDSKCSTREHNNEETIKERIYEKDTLMD